MKLHIFITDKISPFCVRNSAALRQRQTQQVRQSNNIQEEADETTPLIVNPVKKEPKANKGGPSLVAVIMKHWLPILSLVCFTKPRHI